MNRIATLQRRVSIAMAAIVFLLVPLATMAQPGAQAVTDGAGAVGYRLEGEEVAFTFDRSQYEFATRGDSGERVSMADISLDELSEVAVAGEFNGWSTGAWRMELAGPGVYETRRPLEELAERGLWAFKFVIDGMLWVEPPAYAPNIVRTGFSNDSFNLLLMLAEPEDGELPASGRVPAPGERESPGGKAGVPELTRVDSPLLERLTLSASRLPEGCALKPVDEAMGAAPIPVDSNPMITSDHRVISFVSVFVMPPTPEEEAAWEAETSTLGPGAVMTRIEELMAERTSTVRAAYVAVYESSESGLETGVFALEFSEPLSPERRKELGIEGPGGAVVAGERVAAAVWTDDPGRLCFDAARAHVESVLGE
ncbi:MAG: hypothetical protein ABIK85_07960 [Candidatus Eisenbacteria bacterium]